MDTKRPPRFWELARRVVSEAHRLGLAAPGFRTPPVVPGARRTVRRHPGGALVAVAWRGRPAFAVLADMVDGLVLVNGLEGEEAAECRRQLLAELAPAVGADPPLVVPRPAGDHAAPEGWAGERAHASGRAARYRPLP